MSDEAQQEVSLSPDALAVLSQDYSKVDRSMPLLREDIYTLNVADIKFVPSKNKPGKTNLVMKLTTTEDSVDTNGKPLRRGWSVNHTISVDKTENYDPSRNLAQFRDAVLGANAAGQFMPLDQYKDKLLKAKIVVEGERTDKVSGETYPPSNRIKQFIPA